MRNTENCWVNLICLCGVCIQSSLRFHSNLGNSFRFFFCGGVRVIFTFSPFMHMNYSTHVWHRFIEDVNAKKCLSYCFQTDWRIKWNYCLNSRGDRILSIYFQFAHLDVMKKWKKKKEEENPTKKKCSHDLFRPQEPTKYITPLDFFCCFANCNLFTFHRCYGH